MTRQFVRFQVCTMSSALVFAGYGTASASVSQPAPLSGRAAQSTRHDGHGKINWPQLGFDAGHSGFNKYEHQISPQNVRSLSQLWTFNIDDWPGDIVLEDGVLFIPSSSGTLYAADAKTAKQLWTFSSGVPYGWNTGTNTVAADGGLVFTECLISGSYGICALSAQNGQVQWSYILPGSSSNATSPPTVADGLVFFEACSSAGCDHVALNESNGVPVWMAAESCAASYGIPPAVYQRVLYVAEGCDIQGTNAIVAMADQNGELLWTKPIVGVMHGLSVSDRLLAYVLWNGSNGYIGALKAVSGHTIWGPEQVGSAGITSIPAIAYGQIFAWIFIYDYGYVAAYDRRNGHQTWRYTIARSFPSVANGIAWIAMNGSPLALNAATGQYIWDVGGTDNLGLPIIANGIVYGGCNGPHVCAYGLPAGMTR